MTFDIAADLAARASYPQWTEERMRFSDLDPLGHANNNAIGVYFETGRLGLFREAKLHDGKPGEATVVAKLSIDFLKELTYPNLLEVGSRVTRIGGSSFAYVQGVFVGDACIATAETVSVLFDLSARRPRKLDDGQKERLSAFL